jgi:hypothetical protein
MDTLSTLLQQHPTAINATALADIQSIKISFDNWIQSIMEDIENMTRIRKNHTPNFLSQELVTKTAMPNTRWNARGSSTRSVRGQLGSAQISPFEFFS